MLCTILFFGCTKNNASLKEMQQEREFNRTELAIGTVCSVRIFSSDPKIGKKEGNLILDEVFSYLRSFEAIFSANLEGSTLDKINKTVAKQTSVSVEPDLYILLERAFAMAEKTEGAFNPAIGPIVKLWNIGFEKSRVPHKDEIAQALSLCNYKDVVLHDKTISFTKENMGIDLGGIAKGYSIDGVVAILKKHGIDRGIVNFGGDIVALGRKAPEKLWSVGIREPAPNSRGAIMAVAVEQRAVVTSGIYERFIEKDGHRYHHIIDPKTGYPVENDIVSVTILADNATDADVLATACFPLGFEKSMEILKTLPSVDVIFIFNDNTAFASEGIREDLTILSVDDKTPVTTLR